MEPQGHGKPHTSPREDEVVVGPSTQRNKENQCPNRQSPQSRKRRGKAAAEPDFLPCKKAKLEQGNCHQQLLVTPALVDYVNCGGGLGARPSPMSLHRAVAACC
ncbi:immediate early response protein 2 protein-like [Solea senegalensis]|uniref:Immediate early response protein 2 protein-like n=2 Tax=Solea senegalensis TaxID=28829 RepID=A0AAV6RIW9_SOLSE|nr:immediate early response protein 2 protein-like [Solea senegalensis]